MLTKRTLALLPIALLVCLGLTVLSVTAADDADPYNIVSPDWEGWSLTSQASVDDEGGVQVLTVVSEDAVWSYCLFNFEVDPQVMKRLYFTYSYKLDNVVMGENSWDTARLWVNFFNDAGEHINGWDSPSFWKGTTGWKSSKWILQIPKTAVKTTLAIGLNSCSGAISMKDFKLYAQDVDKKNVLPLPAL